jgi:hypothetical protein
VVVRVNGRAAGSAGQACARWRRFAAPPVDDGLPGMGDHPVGDEAAKRFAVLMGVVTFDSDPGRLSAASFMNACGARFPPTVRYMPAGGRR